MPLGRELCQPEIELLVRQKLQEYFQDCETYNVKQSMKVFCNYFCHKQSISVKYALMGNSPIFREIWQDVESTWLNSLTGLEELSNLNCRNVNYN